MRTGLIISAGLCSSDIFVCLRNIFATGSFDAIILDEFRELDEALQDVYRLVAGLEAISGGSHRQLVLRMLGIRHDSIPNLLDELDGLLVEAVQGAIVDGVFIWRTRHPQIADIVTRYKYSDPDSHLALIEDFVHHLNPTVDIERNAIRGLCNETLVVRRGFGGVGQGGSASFDLGDDVVGGLGPDEGSGVVVPV